DDPRREPHSPQAKRAPSAPRRSTRAPSATSRSTSSATSSGFPPVARPGACFGAGTPGPARGGDASATPPRRSLHGSPRARQLTPAAAQVALPLEALEAARGEELVLVGAVALDRALVGVRDLLDRLGARARRARHDVVRVVARPVAGQDLEPVVGGAVAHLGARERREDVGGVERAELLTQRLGECYRPARRRCWLAQR